MARAPKNTAPQTTAQRLDSIVKSARKIMRKDKGLNGDLDRLPVLTWIMFLKFLDDLERMHQDEAELAGSAFSSAIEPPYRWRDWAADKDGITGPDLLTFITAEKATLPDGSEGPGLFAYLRGLRGTNGGRDRRDVIATVFRGVTNRMESGYLLRDVINLINAIHFDSSEEMHTLGRLYETLLREMRDAAGDSGEFYTPRAVVRFMVERINPTIGETVLDPACGTGGFLTEAFSHMALQADTVERREQLQSGSLVGIEAKSLPFLLAQMNLLLHGLESPEIDPGNALRFRLTEIGERERVNVILTNPPFGGEEEAGILANFPDDRRTTETTQLFLQLIMRRLKRKGQGRAAVVVPHGTLFGTGVAARIKADLLEKFNLHTIVRLPEGVFAPYTDIAANLLFFDTSGPTGQIAYWEQPAPEGRRKYSKTAPLQSSDLADLSKWWDQRGDDPRAWLVDGPALIERDASGQVVAVNLDLQNPNAKTRANQRTPSEIITTAAEITRGAQMALEELQAIVTEQRAAYAKIIADAPRMEIGDVAPLVRRSVEIDPGESYSEIGVRSFYRGLFVRRTMLGSEFEWQKLFRIEKGDLVFSNLMAWEQAIGLAESEHAGAVGNHRMLTCEADRSRISPGFLYYYFTTGEGFREILKASPGTMVRNKTLSTKLLPKIPVPVPSLDAQYWVESLLAKARAVKAAQAEAVACLDQLLPAMLNEVFG